MYTWKEQKMRDLSRSDKLRLAMIAFCIIGIFVAVYLSWAEVTDNETACADTGKIDCATVQNSSYSKTMGIPVAVMGLLGYLAILGVLVLEDQVDILAAYGRTFVLGFALFGTMFSAYLSALEGTVLDAWCQWCIASAIVITILLALSIWRWFEFIQPLRK
jgi:uncharacterized membrane protein